MKKLNFAIYSADSLSPKTSDAISTQDVIDAFKRHDWAFEMMEMKKRFDRGETYTLPEFTIGWGEAYLIIAPNYDGQYTVGAHKFDDRDLHIHGEGFSEEKAIESINRFLSGDHDWLVENLN